MPVWVRLPRFPIGLWNRRNIIAIAALIGEPLEIDQSTISQEQIIFARVRVAIDLSKPLPKGNFIGHKGTSTWQPFVYENIPIICTSCGTVGHKALNCKDSPSPENPGNAVDFHPESEWNGNPPPVKLKVTETPSASKAALIISGPSISSGGRKIARRGPEVLTGSTTSIRDGPGRKGHLVR